MAGKRSSVKRLSCTPHSAPNSIDIKARKRIEELFELTDEIINAYNEINEKYVSQIYRKYEQLKETNKKLKETLHRHHCAGCQCTTTESNTNEEEEKEKDEEESSSEEEEDDDSDDDDDEQPTNSVLPSSTTNSIVTRSKKNNPFIISDIEDTQNFDGRDSRFTKKVSHDDDDDDDDFEQISMDTDENSRSRKRQTESSDENYNGDEVDDEDEDNGMACLPLALQVVIRNKATKNKNAKAYLLKIPLYPALCEYLRDQSRTSFDHRPSEKQVRPLIENHLGPDSVLDAKIRMRLRDELREIHRSYLRTLMTDPHAIGAKNMLINKPKLLLKKSPM